MDLKEHEILGDQVDRHWYYRAKTAAMLRMLRGGPVNAVLDVGAGSGFFARQVLDRTQAAHAVCVDPNYAREHEEHHHGKPIRFVHGVDRFEANLVLLMDVLEHVADDAALLRQYVDKAAPGTRFLITVPAHGWMWSSHDVFLEHFRRYTVRKVDRLIADADLQHVRSGYYFGLILPLAAGVRLSRRLNPFGRERVGSDMRTHGRVANEALLRLCYAELPLVGINRLAGLSVVALAVKGMTAASPTRPF